MATFPELILEDLAEFTGRPQSSYTNHVYVATAIKQAFLLFRLGTCLASNYWPDDPTNAELAKYAVLELADSLYLSLGNREVLAGPFQSETIGSYSYSKATRDVSTKTPTGLTWFDLAVGNLSVCEDGSNAAIGSGSTGVFEGDGLFAVDSDGHRTLLGPKDTDSIDAPFTVSTPIPYDPNR